jgi:hypothetical protein
MGDQPIKVLTRLGPGSGVAWRQAQASGGADAHRRRAMASLAAQVSRAVDAAEGAIASS